MKIKFGKQKKYCFFVNRINLKKNHMKKIFTLISILSISIVSLMAQTPNAGFESWTSHSSLLGSYDTPDSWNCPNSQTAIVGVYSCLKGAPGHTGSYAIELITKNIGSPINQLVPGFATTGTIPSSITGSISGGIPYTLRPDSITGWYKYTPQGGEKGFVEFILFGSTTDLKDTIAVGDFSTPSTTVSAYTRFSAAMVYRSANAVANSMWLIGSSSDDGLTASIGSTIYVDDLNLVFIQSGIAEQKAPEFTISPNPAVDHIIIKNELKLNSIFCLYDITGHKLAEEKIGNTSTIINVNTFSEGLYIYNIIDENNVVTKSGKIIIQK